jgi:hypothetical protein
VVVPTPTPGPPAGLSGVTVNVTVIVNP